MRMKRIKRKVLKVIFVTLIVLLLSVEDMELWFVPFYLLIGYGTYRLGVYLDE